MKDLGALMNGSLSDVLRIADKEIRDFIEEASSRGDGMLEPRWAVRRLEKIDRRLDQVGKLLRRERHRADRRTSASVMLQHVETLKGLRALLESSQGPLLAERARLENIRTNLESASSWAASLRGLY